ncbi:nitrogenase component 1 [Intestinibacter sp.]
MLKRVERPVLKDIKDACVLMKDAAFPAPFDSRLEFSCSARGFWNIVHTGMLIPEIHQVYVCAQGCLRGVVLTAAEMNAIDRFSNIIIRENNILEGNNEDLIVEGMGEILSKLPYTPKAVLVYTSCIHHFIGCDLNLVYRRLREKYPDIEFTDCYMNPIMRKSGVTPDQLMRKQLYSLLDKQELDKKSVNIIGNNFATDDSSELVKIIRENGFTLREVPRTKTYKEYKDMGKAAINITYNPVAIEGGIYLENKLNQKHLYLPLSYGFDEIEKNLDILCENLGVQKIDFTENKKMATEAIINAKNIIGNTPIAIDYTLTIRPASLAKLLLQHGFNVVSLYVDSFIADEEDDVKWLKENYPDIKVYSTMHVKMRFVDRHSEQKILALGQKAAYFTGSNNFVNVVESGGMYGFDGIVKLCDLMIDAFLNEKDAKKLIQYKGLGCENYDTNCK